jgi:hypothetical protein
MGEMGRVSRERAAALEYVPISHCVLLASLLLLMAESLTNSPDWDTIEAHRQFEASGADFAAVGDVLGPVLAKPPAMHHVNFKTAVADIVSSAATV